MNKLKEKKWINERQWEYYSIQIHILLSNHIDIPQHHELIDIYNEYKHMEKDVPIQLQEYINLNIQDVKSLNHKITYGRPLKDYIKVIMISSVLRRQATGISKINAIDASIIHNNLNGLKWITKFNKNSKDEINTVKKAVEIIKNDNRKKILITHYQFISTILDEDLNILNRWYLWDNNTHPTENHKYFEFYKNMVNKNIKENDVKVIYLLGQDKEILFRHVENYFTNLCFKNKIVEKNRFSVHEIINCKK